MFVLDTDSITHDQNAHPVLSERVKNTPREQLFTTSVSVEEQLKGRLAYLNRHRNSPRKSALGHADALMRRLQKQRLRIGSQDLRIAAIALLHGFTVVASNHRDFAQVPKLKIADWTAAAPQET